MIITDATYRVTLMGQGDQLEFENELSRRFEVMRLSFEVDGEETEISLLVKGKLYDTQVMFYLPDDLDLLSSAISYKDESE